MLALRRIATPVLAVSIAGCTFPVDDYHPSESTGDASTDGESRADAASKDGSSNCTCIKQDGDRCEQWAPPRCGK